MNLYGLALTLPTVRVRLMNDERWLNCRYHHYHHDSARAQQTSCGRG